MSSALSQTEAVPWPTIGSIGVDSLTRVGQLSWVEQALAKQQPLNGYPLVSHPLETTRAMVANHPAFPIQVRHGTARPEAILSMMQSVGLTAADGGPLSHCLPHGRTRLRRAIRSWRICVEQLASWREQGIDIHLESHGGCVGGLMCPPSLRVALAILEGLFFCHHGIASISLSYAQGPNIDQDLGALTALKQLTAVYLSGVRSHTVVHTYMGGLPQTESGLRRLIEDAAILATRSGASRLVVRPRGAPHPCKRDLRQALVWAQNAAQTPHQRAFPSHGRRRRVSSTNLRYTPHTQPTEAMWGLSPRAEQYATQIAREACSIIEATRSLHHNLDHALELAVADGLIDLPGCLHPENRRRTAARLDRAGAIVWVETGRLPFPVDLAVHSGQASVHAAGRMAMEVGARYDRLYGRHEYPSGVHAASSSARMLLQ